MAQRWWFLQDWLAPGPSALLLLRQECRLVNWLALIRSVKVPITAELHWRSCSQNSLYTDLRWTFKLKHCRFMKKGPNVSREDCVLLLALSCWLGICVINHLCDHWDIVTSTSSPDSSFMQIYKNCRRRRYYCKGCVYSSYWKYNAVHS